MATPERVISPRQLHRLSPLLLGFWLVAIVLATFQPCAVAAESLSIAVDSGRLPASQERDSRCQPAQESHEKSDCCPESHYTYCSLPDIVKHDDSLSLRAGAHLALFRSGTFLLPFVDERGLGSFASVYRPPSDLPRILLSGTRLLI